MKNILYTLALLLFTTATQSQTTDLSCPNVEWLKEVESSIIRHPWLTVGSANFKGNILMSGNYQGITTIDTYTINHNHNRTFGILADINTDGQVEWLRSANSTGRCVFLDLNKPKSNKQNHTYAILLYNQATTFNGHTYTSAIVDNGSSDIRTNADYALLTLDANKQTTGFFTIPNLKLQDIVPDTLGNIYAIATFNAPITIASQTFTPQGSHDALVLKINTQNQVIWAVPIQGKGNEEITNITIDHNQNVYIAGHFNSDTLQIGNQQIIDTARKTTFSYTGYNIVISKINNNGTIQWTTHTGAERNTIATADDILTDKEGNVYITGRLNGKLLLNNNPKNSTLRPNGNSYNSNAFVLRYNPNNTAYDALIYHSSKRVGNGSTPYNFILHPFDNVIYVAGKFNDTLFTSSGTYIGPYSNTKSAGFISRIIGLNGELRTDWTIIAQTDSIIMFSSITSDLQGALYVSGRAWGNSSFGNININNSKSFYAKISGLSKEVTIANNTHTAVQEDATYQWLDCNNNMQPITGATSRSYTPLQQGKYAVAVSNSFCTVVSECGSLSLPETTLLQEGTQVYPNPFTHTLTITVQETYRKEILQLHLTDILGRTILHHKGTLQELNTYMAQHSSSLVPRQLYQLQLTHTGTQETVTHKIVKE